MQAAIDAGTAGPDPAGVQGEEGGRGAAAGVLSPAGVWRLAGDLLGSAVKTCADVVPMVFAGLVLSTALRHVMPSLEATAARTAYHGSFLYPFVARVLVLVLVGNSYAPVPHVTCRFVLVNGGWIMLTLLCASPTAHTHGPMVNAINAIKYRTTAWPTPFAHSGGTVWCRWYCVLFSALHSDFDTY